MALFFVHHIHDNKIQIYSKHLWEILDQISFELNWKNFVSNSIDSQKNNKLINIALG